MKSIVLVLPVLFAFFGQESQPKDKFRLEKSEVSEAQERLGVKDSKETEKLGQIESDKHNIKTKDGQAEREKYIFTEDEEAAKNTGIPVEDIRKASKRAMDSRTDRKEDSWIEVFFEEEVVGEDGKKSTKETRVSKMRKKKRPEPFLEDTWKEQKKEVRRIELAPGKTLIIRANGACPSQCEGLIKAFELEVQA